MEVVQSLSEDEDDEAAGNRQCFKCPDPAIDEELLASNLSRMTNAELLLLFLQSKEEHQWNDALLFACANSASVDDEEEDLLMGFGALEHEENSTMETAII